MKNKLDRNAVTWAAAPMIAALFFTHNAAAQETVAPPELMVVTLQPEASEVMVISAEQAGPAGHQLNANTNQAETVKPDVMVINAEQVQFVSALPPGILAAGTQISVSLNEVLSSKTATVGAIVPFTVSSDVKLGNDIAIPKGSVGQATIIEMRKRGSFGKPGILVLEYNYVTLADGQKVELSGRSVQHGQRKMEIGENGVNSVINSGSALGGVGGVGIASVGLIAAGFLVKGDHAEIHPQAGQTVNLRSNTPINALMAAQPVSTVMADIDAAQKPATAVVAEPAIAPAAAATAETVISAAP